jgi:hypothetical protein
MNWYKTIGKFSKFDLNKRLLMTLKDGVEVYLVNGDAIRDNIKGTSDSDFVFGGHYWRYPKFIGKNEIFIDSTMQYSDDIIATIYHEAIERKLMKEKGYSYDKAHDIAKKKEDNLRRTKLKNFRKKIKS